MITGVGTGSQKMDRPGGNTAAGHLEMGKLREQGLHAKAAVGVGPQ